MAQLATVVRAAQQATLAARAYVVKAQLARVLPRAQSATWAGADSA